MLGFRAKKLKSRCDLAGIGGSVEITTIADTGATPDLMTDAFICIGSKSSSRCGDLPIAILASFLMDSLRWKGRLCPLTSIGSSVSISHVTLVFQPTPSHGARFLDARIRSLSLQI